MCQTDGFLQHAVVCIFFIFMYPSVKCILTEAYVVLRASRVGFTHEEIDDKILLYHLYSPMSKRLLIFFMIVFPESCILTLLYFVGSKFIITSDDVMDLIINSVAIAFIMDIDNMSREYFQNEEVTEHVDGMHFETKMQAMEAKLTTIDDVNKDYACDEDDSKCVATLSTQKVMHFHPLN